MKKNFLFFCFVFSPLCTQAQDAAFDSYMRNFARSDIAAKIKILKETANAEFAGALCDFALRFCLDYADALNSDADMLALTSLAVKGVGDAREKNAADTLLKLYAVYPNSDVRVEILRALAETAWENKEVIAGVNRILEEQNKAFAAGAALDYLALKTGVEVLGVLASESSYPALFTAYTLPYPEEIIRTVKASLERIGDFEVFLLYVVKNNPPAEKMKALKLGMDEEKLSFSIRNEIVQAALEAGFEANDAASSELRYEAVRQLTNLRWSGAVKAVIRHFYQTQTDFVNGKAEKARLIEAILCLGAMENSEAAQVLSIQLGLFNIQVEQKGSNGFDVDIMIAVVNALGDIGDKVAFDHLLYMNFLPYPPEVLISAKKALARLKW
jgi:HEAT repeat protein